VLCTPLWKRSSVSRRRLRAKSASSATRGKQAEEYDLIRSSLATRVDADAEVRCASIPPTTEEGWHENVRGYLHQCTNVRRRATWRGAGMTRGCGRERALRHVFGL
jgi:hypothetical protein